MFTGIVEEVGSVFALSSRGDMTQLVLRAKRVLEGTILGDSISIEGVCQTVTELHPLEGLFAVDTLAESLKKTTLGSLKPGSPVNLERALRPDSRMGGHIVQGHTSSTVRIEDLQTLRSNVYLSVEVPVDLLRYCVAEWSIALDGISLTIANISGNIVTVNIIPSTIKNTSLASKKRGDLMNLETDIIGRYVESLLPVSGATNSTLSFERLRELGY